MTHTSPVGRHLTVVLAVFALVVLPLAIYVAGYRWLGEQRDWYAPLTVSSPSQPILSGVERRYRRHWMTVLFEPAGHFEQWARGIEVNVTSEEDLAAR